MKKGDLVARQDSNGIMDLKWRDRRDVIILSTKHDSKLNANSKSKVIDDYNGGKCLPVFRIKCTPTLPS